MAVLVWIWWLVNNFALLIFSLNFCVSIISQAYEEALYKLMVKSYTFKIQKVLDATALTKMLGIGRRMMTFSISF